MTTAHLGMVWRGLGRVRPRIEVGYEGGKHTGLEVNLGIGFTL